MKCPKCRYLSFEPELRCKHCGFDFALAEPDLPARRFDELEQQDPDLPMADLQLRPAPVAAAAPAPLRRGATALAFAERDMAPVARSSPAPTPLVTRRAQPDTGDLPLFLRKGVASRETDPVELPLRPAQMSAVVDDEDPAVDVPAAPRPLVVRRRAPDSGRQPGPSPVIAAPALPVSRADRDLLEYLRRVETEAAPAAFSSSGRPSDLPEPAADVVAPMMRLEAAVLDVVVLGVLNAAIVWMTLRQCDLGLGQLTSLPVLPLTAFLASLNLSYLLLFNVIGGQTIGKMVFGLRVVGDDVAPTAKQLSYRAMLTVASILVLGLGFIPALVGRGLAVHDRLTHTRVVRA